MSKKIIGVTVGTTLPKPNFKQTDPTKGDYIRNKPDFDGLKTKVNDIQALVGDTAVSEQITSAVAQKSQVQMITQDASEILSTLKIHKLTQAEYDQKLADGTLDENALYLTPDEEIDLSSYVTAEELDTKADVNHIHEDLNTLVSNLNTLVGDTEVSVQISEAIKNKSDVGHTHTAAEVGALSADDALGLLTGLATEEYVDDAIITKVDKVAGKGLSTNDYTTEDKNKLSTIEEGATKTVIDSELSNTSTNPVQNKVVEAAISNLSALVGDEKISEQISTAISSKSDVGHTHTASEVGADASGSAASALTSAKSYTDTKIADLINSAPTTLDTLGEIATAMQENGDVVEALNSAIGTKANASDLASHIGDKSNPHGVTLPQLGITASVEELNYIDGVTSNVQTQLDALSGLIGETEVSKQIESAVAQKSQVQIITWGDDD